MSVFLYIQDGEKENEIPCGVVTSIGRDKTNDVVLTDELASRNHSMIRRLSSGDYYLFDVGSSNGSYVNKKRVTMPVLLKDGDQIHIGGTCLQFRQVKSETDANSVEELDRTTLVQTSDINQITILVADIRGYTSLSEQTPVQVLTKIMSQWFRDVSDCIQTNDGVVDKFIGDCVYARWDMEAGLDSTIMKTVKAAVEINDITIGISRTHPEITQRLSTGVGINTGKAAVSIGLNHTALGDAVNLAFRLEGASKYLEKDIVLSLGSYSCLPQVLWSGKETTISVKGKKDPVRICALTFPEARAFIEGKV